MPGHTPYYGPYYYGYYSYPIFGYLHGGYWHGRYWRAGYYNRYVTAVTVMPTASTTGKFLSINQWILRRWSCPEPPFCFYRVQRASFFPRVRARERYVPGDGQSARIQMVFIDRREGAGAGAGGHGRPFASRGERAVRWKAVATLFAYAGRSGQDAYGRAARGDKRTFRQTFLGDCGAGAPRHCHMRDTAILNL